MISPSDVLQRYTVDDLNRAADEYFSHVNPDALLQKPFHDPSETAEIVLTLMHVIKGLALAPGDTVLDFGAGSCWTSRILVNFGYNVIASDVSLKALEFGRELFRRHPPRQGMPPLSFLPFDGYHIDLDDCSIDAIVCASAFHHVPNPREILSEFSRVLRPWGRAGFSEPGPRHSETPQAQHEMQNFAVLENNVVIENIWKWAQDFGFTDLSLCLYQPEPFFLSLDSFTSFLKGAPNAAFEAGVRNLMQERRLFILEKGQPGLRSSATPSELDGMLEFSEPIRVSADRLAVVQVRVQNTGTAFWRPSNAAQGPVRIGASWISPDGQELVVPRLSIPMPHRFGMLPGDTLRFKETIPIPDGSAEWILRLQLVSELVAWFGPIIETRVAIL